MKKIILTIVTLFALSSCSKDSSETTASPETPISIILPKKIEKENVTYNYEYDGNKIKSYKDANSTQLYQYTYTGDQITKFSRIQNPNDLQGYEYNFTYETSGFNPLKSYKYSFYTKTYSSIFTAAFANNTLAVDITNKSNTSDMTSPYDDNLLSAPFYTVDNNWQIIKVVTKRKNMPEFTITSNDIVTITTIYEYDTNDAHKNPFANVTGMNKLLFYDPILSAKYNIRNITTTYSTFSAIGNVTPDVTRNVHYEYVYNNDGYPTQITSIPSIGQGNPTVTKITY
jgi:Prokaryotic membrane lipoprotein lipid attachment site